MQIPLFALEIAMPDAVTSIRVSGRGQMSLPAPARHRWKIADGGDIGAIDLGDAVLLVPGGAEAARRAVAAAVGNGRYAEAVALIDDADLQTQ